MARRKMVAVDFDGTIADYSKRQQGLGELLPGAREFLQKLHDDGWVIIIWTGRNENGLIAKYLDANKVPYDYINENPNGLSGSPKIYADVYLDDRGVTFTGSWEKAYNDIQKFQGWDGRKLN